MTQINKQSLILLGGAILLVLIVIFVAVILFLSPEDRKQSQIIPTPTPVPYARDADGNFTFTPLQKTTINQTTTDNVEKRGDLISQSVSGSTTIYVVESDTPGEIDEIRTQNGVVVFESTNIFNKATGSYPPKATVYEREFGEPERVLEGVSELGLHIEAQIYAEDGFTLFVNRSTNTVYEVHRFLPMSTEEYESEYAAYIQPAPPYQREFFAE